MVGAQAGIFRHAPPELTVDVHDHVIGTADALHLREEALDGIGAVLKLAVMRRRLVDVRIEETARATARSRAAWENRLR